MVNVVPRTYQPAEEMRRIRSAASGPLEPLVILGDLHLVRNTAPEDLAPLRPLWVQARTIVFNGDTVESPAGSGAADCGSVLQRLRESCAEDSVEAIFIAGNTDFATSPLSYLLLAEGRLLATHGGVVFPELSPWRYDAARYRRARQEALAKMEPTRLASLEGQLEASQQALIELHGPTRVSIPGPLGLGRRPHLRWLSALRVLVRLLRAWRAAPGLAANFLDRYAPEVRCLVMSHTHHAGIWRKGDLVVINTGSFKLPARPWAVKLQDQRLEVFGIRKRQGMYSLGNKRADFCI